MTQAISLIPQPINFTLQSFFILPLEILGIILESLDTDNIRTLALLSKDMKKCVYSAIPYVSRLVIRRLLSLDLFPEVWTGVKHLEILWIEESMNEEMMKMGLDYVRINWSNLESLVITSNVWRSIGKLSILHSSNSEKSSYFMPILRMLKIISDNPFSTLCDSPNLTPNLRILSGFGHISRLDQYKHLKILRLHTNALNIQILNNLNIVELQLFKVLRCKTIHHKLNSPTLRKLSLICTSSVFIGNLQNLESLELYGNISLKNIVLKNLTNLNLINLESRISVDILRSAFPNLRYLNTFGCDESLDPEYPEYSGNIVVSHNYTYVEEYEKILNRSWEWLS